MSQNIWNLQGRLLRRQLRRAQLVERYVREREGAIALDIGCAEGYFTSFISKAAAWVVGIDVELLGLRLAKTKVTGVDFISASIDSLPFRAGIFDTTCVLEVLEHLPRDVQEEGFREIDRVTTNNSLLVISVPFREQISYTRCVHCGELTPLWGHLHVLDEDKVTALLPAHYELLESMHLPNMESISCSSLMRVLPARIWFTTNSLLGMLGKGYWIVLKYAKNTRIGHLNRAHE